MARNWLLEEFEFGLEERNRNLGIFALVCKKFVSSRTDSKYAIFVTLSVNFNCSRQNNINNFFLLSLFPTRLHIRKKLHFGKPGKFFVESQRKNLKHLLYIFSTNSYNYFLFHEPVENMPKNTKPQLDNIIHSTSHRSISVQCLKAIGVSVVPVVITVHRTPQSNRLHYNCKLFE